jgi:hypothetical protein
MLSKGDAAGVLEGHLTLLFLKKNKQKLAWRAESSEKEMPPRFLNGTSPMNMVQMTIVAE